MTPFITTFFTEGYKDHADALKASAKEFGLTVHATRYDHLRSWHEAVSFKPQHILLMLETLPPDEGAGILWVDADARFRKVPDWNLLSHADFGACLFRWSPRHSLEALTGTLWFAKNPRVEDFVRRWCGATEKWKRLNNDTPEQHSLMEVLEEDKRRQNPLRFVELPVEWVWIEPEFNSMFLDKRPSISHLQASRERR